jgi:probable HAF family extracellular repeat protein
MPKTLTYGFSTIDPPGSTYTIATAINDLGQIVGFYEDANHVTHAFVETGGHYVTIDPNNSLESGAVGINASGQTIGWYFTSASHQLGFLYSNDGFTTIDPSGSTLTDPTGINAKGEVVGDFREAMNRLPVLQRKLHRYRCSRRCLHGCGQDK